MRSPLRLATAIHGARVGPALVALALLAVGCARSPAPVAPLSPPPARLPPAYDPPRGAWIEPEELWARLQSARYRLLGEQHDNPAHHRLQAAIVRGLAQRGLRPIVAFEMLDAERQHTIRAIQRSTHPATDALRRAVQWETSGWPPWPLYEPLFAAALEAELPIIAAQLSSAEQETLVRDGPDAVANAELRALASRPLPERARRALLEGIREGHCGRLPESELPRMARIQRVWEAQMALVLTRSAGADGAVLIAGRGHLRHGSGVPWALRQLDPSAETLTLAFLEVETGLRDDQGHVVWPRELRGDLASYDLVLPSDPVDRGDPCDRVIPRPVDEPISERGAGERSAGTEPPS